MQKTFLENFSINYKKFKFETLFQKILLNKVISWNFNRNRIKLKINNVSNSIMLV
jgi:hypothetical protein